MVQLSDSTKRISRDMVLEEARSDDEMYDVVGEERLLKDVDGLVDLARQRLERVSKVDPNVDPKAMIRAELDQWFTVTYEFMEDKEVYGEYSRLMEVWGERPLTFKQFVKKKRGESPRDRLDYWIDKFGLDVETGKLSRDWVRDKYKKAWSVIKIDRNLLPTLLNVKAEKVNPDRIINFFI